MLLSKLFERLAGKEYPTIKGPDDYNSPQDEEAWTEYYEDQESRHSIYRKGGVTGFWVGYIVGIVFTAIIAILTILFRYGTILV